MTRLEIAVRIAEHLEPGIDWSGVSPSAAEALIAEISKPQHDPDGRPKVLMTSAYAWRVAGDLIALALDADKQEAQKK